MCLQEIEQRFLSCTARSVAAITTEPSRLPQTLYIITNYLSCIVLKSLLAPENLSVWSSWEIRIEILSVASEITDADIGTEYLHYAFTLCALCKECFEANMYNISIIITSIFMIHPPGTKFDACLCVRPPYITLEENPSRHYPCPWRQDCKHCYTVNSWYESNASGILEILFEGILHGSG